MRFYGYFISRNNFAFNLAAIKELIKEGIRGITPGDWAKCVKHVLSVERVYWLKEIAAEEDLEPVVIDLASASDCSFDTDAASETEGISEI